MRRFFRIVLICTIAVGMAAGVFVYGTAAGKQLRMTAAETILSTQHREWAFHLQPILNISHEELNASLEAIRNPPYINSAELPVVAPLPSTPPAKPGMTVPGHERGPRTDATPEEEAQEKGWPEPGDDLTVKVTTVRKHYNPTYYYVGKVMEISNPYNVKIINSSLEDHGEQIFVIAKRAGAIGAINASGFVDPEGKGNGGTATGIVIADGEITNTPGGNDERTYVAGLTDEAKLVTGFYSANELLQLGVVSAAGFKPQLISNGKKMVRGDGGWGIGPRTAIGQKEDGTILFLVIDGRQTHSIGATIEEVQNILYDMGAVNAMAMDGGSSSSMWFNGENITTPSSLRNIPRYLPNIWAVVPDEGQKVTIIEEEEAADL